MKLSTLFNGLAYQLGWFACVLGAAWGWEDLGTALALGLVIAHLSLAETPQSEWPLLLVAAFLGLLVETFHAAIGVLDLPRHQPGEPAPIWLIVLWLQFATALHFSMRWLSRRYLLASALGFVGGPLAFLGGESLGAAQIGAPRLGALAVLGVSWSLALPALVAVADRLGGAGRYRVFPSAAESEA